MESRFLVMVRSWETTPTSSQLDLQGLANSHLVTDDLFCKPLLPDLEMCIGELVEAVTDKPLIRHRLEIVVEVIPFVHVEAKEVANVR
jgi:hypothetical protein